MAGRRRPTNTDVELRRTELRYDLARVGIIGVSIALCILASALPLSMIRGMVKPLAGKTTVVRLNVALSVVVSISLVLNGFQYLKGLGRKHEIQRLRDRVSELERKAGFGPASTTAP